jgi:hypothetical protein
VSLYSPLQASKLLKHAGDIWMLECAGGSRTANPCGRSHRDLETGQSDADIFLPRLDFDNQILNDENELKTVNKR